MKKVKFGEEFSLTIKEKAIVGKGLEIELKDISEGETPTGFVTSARLIVKKGKESTEIYLSESHDSSKGISKKASEEWNGYLISLKGISLQEVKLKVEKV